MASSVENIAWQEVVSTPCALCDKEDDVNSFCKDCHQYLCDTCKRLHLRSTSSINHKIVPKAEGYKLRQVKKVICNDHNAPFNVFCATCGRHICTECLTSRQHNGHEFSDIETYAKELNDKLQRQIKEKENEGNCALTEMSEYSKVCNDAIAQCDNHILKIKGRVAGLIDDAKKIETEMVQKVTKRKSDLVEMEKQRRQQILSVVNESRRKSTDLERERQSQSSISIVDFVGRAREVLKAINVPKVPTDSVPSHVDFKPGSSNFDQLRDMIGKLQLRERHEMKTLQVALSGHLIIEHDLLVYSKVLSLCVAEQESICVGVSSSPRNKLIIVTNDGFLINECELSHDFSPFSLAQVDGENILVSSYEKELKLWNFLHNKMSALYTAVEILRDVVVTKDQGYLVAEGSSPKRSVVCHIDRKGGIIEKVGLGRSLKDEDAGIIRRMIPYRKNMYLLLIKDKIFIMDNKFYITEAFALEKSWKITRIAGDQLGHIICSSESDVFVFNERGIKLQRYKIPMSSSDRITCIAEGNNNRLIVGTLAGCVKILRYMK